MATINYLRDSKGRVNGIIEESVDGGQIIRSSYGKYLGTYDKRTDITRDAYGRYFGKGNLLTMLLAQNNNKMG